MMRKLTQKENDNAPEWATHYSITEHDTAHFERVGVHHNLEGKPMTLDYVQYLPIPRKDKEFVHGCNVYLVGGKRFVGRYVGINPETGSIVTVKDAEFKCFHNHQVAQ